MDPRLSASLLAGKTALLLSRRLGIGGGTTFPGTVARRVDPSATAKLVGRLSRGATVVTGTNGKTTTSRLLSRIMQAADLHPVHNRAGANLIGGVTSALVAASGLSGQVRADIGLFEVDEAVLPSVLLEARPRVVLITNLFRDQLDRYGEVDYLARIWRQGLAQLDEQATVVLNADDPLVANLGEGLRSRIVYYGLQDEREGLPSLPHAADSKSCLHCGTRLDYSIVYYGHLGKYRCPNCGAARPVPEVGAVAVKTQGTAGSELVVATPRGELALHSTMPGVYNLYNTVAAVAAAEALGLDHAAIKQAVETFSAAFGRIERIPVGDKQLFLALVKNPVGFGEVLRTVLSDGHSKNLFIIINDKFADGTDISWLWDVDFELVAGRASFVMTSGLRGEDMALRLKYAGVDVDSVLLEKNLGAALEKALALTPAGETLYVLPTYTALLEVRDLLRRLGHVGRFWED
ncbi:MAG: Mur ligase family protein [Chloroflexi bacterium]|nr:Mur ligase family protein [Chloroflexota bacterium]MCL5109092.1 Mur ligase family protein [Chloroflexota bacterium]